MSINLSLLVDFGCFRFSRYPHVFVGRLSPLGGFAHELAGFGLRLGDDLRGLLFSISARFCSDARVFQALGNLVLAVLQHFQDRLVSPHRQQDEHDREVEDLEEKIA